MASSEPASSVQSECCFCGGSNPPVRRTLYGTPICNNCHGILLLRDVKSDLGNLDSRIRSCEGAIANIDTSTKRLSRPLAARRARLREEKQSLLYREPVSWTERSILDRSIPLRIINFYSHSWKKWFLDKS